MFRLSLRLLLRDWRAGELRVLVMALLIAVTCVSSVSFFTSRISQALKYQSSELLGADLRLVADHPVGTTARNMAKKIQLRTAETRSFRSMVLSGEKSQLVEIKAAGPGYPLRGHLRISTDRLAAEEITEKLPGTGEVWVDARLLQQLGLSIGDSVQVGNLLLRITAILTYEPDRSGEMFSLAPRLLMRLDDLSATGLDQEGSRMQYVYLVAGDQNAVEDFRHKMKSALGRGERIEGAADARREIRIALQRAQQFLGLAAVVAVILACVAIAMAARQFSQRHMDTCAIMRCFGALQSQITTLFVNQLLIIGLFTGIIGVLFGFVAQLALTKLLGSLLLVILPQPSFEPLLTGMGVAFAGLIGFALPPILQLRNVSTLKVLNRDLGNSKPYTKIGSLVSYGSGLGVLTVLLFMQAGDLRLGLWLLMGIVGAVIILWSGSKALLAIIHLIAGNGRSAWQYGLINLTRRSNASVIQVMAFGLGLMVLLLLTVVRGDLLRGWSEGLPTDAPNRFVINIQSGQVSDVQSFLMNRELDTARLYPMVRGRLVRVNNKPISPEDFLEQRTKNLVTREFNLSWAEHLQNDNKIIEGRWWPSDGFGKRQFSVEEGIAKAIGISVGDSLTYDIAGKLFTAEVTSLRTVQWDSMKANFFVLAPPHVLENFPVSYITSFYLPDSRAPVLDELVKTFPNLTVIDITSILSQVRLIIDRVSLAVEYVFGFTLAAGLAVMYAAIQSTLDDRLKENAIMRALGARRRRLWAGLASEFFALGSLAGLLAAVMATILGFAIAQYVLELDYLGNSWLWVIGMLLGGLGIGLVGVAGTRKVLKSPPLTVLRNT